MKIAIVGAGIGGLTAAALLNEQGHEVKIFEKNSRVSEVGAGIGIHDLAKGIKNVGQVIDTMEVLDDKNNMLSRIK